MATFIGTTASAATYNALSIPSSIISFSIANVHGSTINISVGLVYGSTYYIIHNKSLGNGDSYIYAGNEILVPAGYSIYVSASGDIDYIFNIQ